MIYMWYIWQKIQWTINIAQWFLSKVLTIHFPWQGIGYPSQVWLLINIWVVLYSILYYTGLSYRVYDTQKCTAPVFEILLDMQSRQWTHWDCGQCNYIWNVMGQMQWKCDAVKYLDPLTLITFPLHLVLLKYVPEILIGWNHSLLHHHSFVISATFVYIM